MLTKEARQVLRCHDFSRGSVRLIELTLDLLHDHFDLGIAEPALTKFAI